MSFANKEILFSRFHRITLVKIRMDRRMVMEEIRVLTTYMVDCQDMHSPV